jgi:hypothetical protein
MDAELETNVFHFQTDAPFSASVQALANHEDSGITVVFLPGHSTKLTLQVDLHFSQNSSAISLTLEVKGHGTFYLHYVGGCSIPLTYTPDARHFLYGLGERANTRWIHLTRDLPIDLQKVQWPECGKMGGILEGVLGPRQAPRTLCPAGWPSLEWPSTGCH